jgi:enamine deaminase RidA (YjgF/YER057c/UK114 family)
MNEIEIAAGLSPTPGYRYATRVGDQLFVAGQVPHDGRGNIVGPGEPAEQARQCLDNLRLVLETHSFAVFDIRHLTVYVVGTIDDLSAAWDVVTGWFADDVPPASLLGVARLGYHHQLVEVDATVVSDRTETQAPSLRRSVLRSGSR